MKPFDVVKTPRGGLAVITEIAIGAPQRASIKYFYDMNPHREHNAWWYEGGKEGVIVVDSLLRIIADAMAHPFGENVHQGDRYFMPTLTKENVPSVTP